MKPFTSSGTSRQFKGFHAAPLGKKLLYNFNSTDHPYTYSALLFTPTDFFFFLQRGQHREERTRSERNRSYFDDCTRPLHTTACVFGRRRVGIAALCGFSLCCSTDKLLK
ncbi:hypothetical protein CEXT_136881 [Caerostris extrusa]|uniref:Uncharacterized protein n=1 Tax=Caerostris extrusa TaxID=172846 RepID=A0AAV4U7Q0_CAEEX|nr:hypothetical protein CEXT_136881 [Caerostris extrusa]